MAIDHIDDLRVFAQVVDSGTLAAAGRVLDLSPTLVSRRLARLEQSLGVRLLERTTRSLRITEEGRAFYARCHRILTEMDFAVAELQPASQAVSGLVRVVLPSSTLAYGIMESLRELLDLHPELSVHIQLSDHPVDLLAGGWDVATHIGPPRDSSHVGKRLGTITAHLVATPEYLARAGIPEQPSDLSHHQCLRFASHQSQNFWPIIDGSGQLHRIPVGGRLICHDLITLLNAVNAGWGIGVLPNVALKKA